MLRSHPGVLVALAISFLGLACDGTVNHPPEVKAGPRANSLSAKPGEVLQLVLEVQDPDGDALEYHWSQFPEEPAGRFSDPGARAPTWTAPHVERPTTFVLQVNVLDNEGGGVLGTVPSVLVEVP